MGRRFETHPLALVVLGFLLAWAAPAAAESVVDFARNAGKVDGIDASTFTQKPFKRAGKLVATDEEGFLPNNILQKSKDADRLDGLDSTAFELDFECAPGEIAAHAALYEVSFGPPSSFRIGNSYSCVGGAPSFERKSVGVYEVWFPGLFSHPCDVIGMSHPPVVSIDTLSSSPLVATYELFAAGEPCSGDISDSYDVAFRLRVVDLQGQPVDSDLSFTVVNRGRCC